MMLYTCSCKNESSCRTHRSKSGHLENKASINCGPLTRNIWVSETCFFYRVKIGYPAFYLWMGRLKCGENINVDADELLRLTMMPYNF
jgi:hypothetical protein